MSEKYYFSSALYSKKAVESAAADFSELAQFSIAEENGKIKVSVRPESGTEINEEFWDEFSNHILAQMA